jgi:DNA primase large subunit
MQVDWTRVADLVERRRVLLHKGQAYVPMREQSTLVVTEFQQRLNKALEVIFPFQPLLSALVRFRAQIVL